MAAQQHVTQLDQDHLVLVVRSPRPIEPVVLAVLLLIGAPLFLVAPVVGVGWSLASGLGWLGFYLWDETHRLEIRRDRVTWDGRPVDYVWIEDVQLEVEGVVYPLRGRLTVRAMRLVRDGLREAEFLVLGLRPAESLRETEDPPPVPQELDQLRQRRR